VPIPNKSVRLAFLELLSCSVHLIIHEAHAVALATSSTANAAPAAAQRTLHHEDPQTTAKAYQHIDAGGLAVDINDVFENE
jgi:hypothetical protein